MFVPSVGYLFTYDRQSAQRYSYYNKLERCRRVRVYRELINEELDEEDEEEGDEDEAAKNASEQCQQGVSASRSDNDLRVKKSVTFLAHVVEHKQTHLRANSSGESSSTSSSAMTTPTAASPYHKPSAVASEDRKVKVRKAKKIQNYRKQFKIRFTKLGLLSKCNNR